MAPTRTDATYGGTCPACAERGHTWWSPPPNREPIQLCEEHEQIVVDAAGWERDDTRPPGDA